MIFTYRLFILRKNKWNILSETCVVVSFSFDSVISEFFFILYCDRSSRTTNCRPNFEWYRIRILAQAWVFVVVKNQLVICLVHVRKNDCIASKKFLIAFNSCSVFSSFFNIYKKYFTFLCTILDLSPILKSCNQYIY